MTNSNLKATCRTLWDRYGEVYTHDTDCPNEWAIHRAAMDFATFEEVPQVHPHDYDARVEEIINTLEREFQ